MYTKDKSFSQWKRLLENQPIRKLKRLIGLKRPEMCCCAGLAPEALSNTHQGWAMVTHLCLILWAIQLCQDWKVIFAHVHCCMKERTKWIAERRVLISIASLFSTPSMKTTLYSSRGGLSITTNNDCLPCSHLSVLKEELSERRKVSPSPCLPFFPFPFCHSSISFRWYMCDLQWWICHLLPSWYLTASHDSPDLTSPDPARRCFAWLVAKSGGAQSQTR